MWGHLNKPFSKVFDVTLVNCNIFDKESLNRLFPKMKYLKFNCIQTSLFVNPDHFTKLRSLRIIQSSYQSSSLCGSTIATMLRLNPQLENFYISTTQPLSDSSDFQNALKTLQKLEYLSFAVSALHSDIINTNISLKSVRSFYINFQNNNNITKIPFRFERLDICEIICSNQLNAEFYDFVEKHPKIQKLSLAINSLSVTDKTKLSKILPLLVSFDLNQCKISANEVTQFLSMFQSLKEFKFVMYDNTTLDKIQSQVGKEWDTTLDKGQIVVTRLSPMAKKRKLS